MDNIATSHARRWWVLMTVSVSQLMVALDSTVINIALPRAQVDLNFSVANRQWLITAYALSFGSLMLLGGRLSDLWGRRASLMVGLVGFALASAVGGAARNFAALVCARAVQGAFGALLAPAALAALTLTFREPRERATAFSIFGAVGGSGAAIGLLLGGALTQWASWRWCLTINLFFAALSMVGVILFVERGRGERAVHLDLVGTVLASAGLFALVFGLGHAVTTGWGNFDTWFSLGVGAVLLVVFVLWQRRSAHPLLPLRIVKDRTRGGSLIALFFTNIGIFSISLFLAYYLQNTLGYSPMKTGLLFLPLVAALAFSASLASARLLALVGPRPLVPVGMLLGMMGMILFTKLPAHADYLGHVMPGLIVTGLGLGLIYAPSTATATAGIEPRDAGAASAMVSTAQQIGGSVGIATLNTIAVITSRRALACRPTGATSTCASAVAATLHGYAVAFWWAAGFFGVGALVTLLLLESGVPELEGDLIVP
ncbi:MAG: MFS transporter [Acidobacteriota bacterium]|nr:MFS transporter [Acidobacteriota bacterium]MDE3092808.1 MFS transporter [Acidobacteriota bacterium]MDE3139565.1 MFS transporter [Acidobacteriota bacterium]MDE3145840.1 MFS transporter [Acidobacteriota bacterium]